MTTCPDIARRRFLGIGALGMAGTFLTGDAAELPRESSLHRPVDRIELFKVNVEARREFSTTTWANRQHVFARVASGDVEGWSEVLVSTNRPDFDLADWSDWLSPVVGMSPHEALARNRIDLLSGARSRAESELVEIALLDLVGRMLGRPTVELLGLRGRDPIFGLQTVLSRSPDDVARVAGHHSSGSAPLKLKLFADEMLDRSLVRAARAVLPDGAYLLGDLNRGYRRSVEDPPVPLPKLADALRSLYDAGLNGVEDPAHMAEDEWADLQSMVGDLDLVPDHPLRPAAVGAWKVTPEMGKIFNLHPDTMGSIIDAVGLANRVSGFGADVMVGDDSFVGPGCTIWQQIALGVSAVWVEALEKPDESDIFPTCVKSVPTERLPDGRITVSEWAPGFGVEVNVHRLTELADAHVLV